MVFVELCVILHELADIVLAPDNGSVGEGVKLAPAESEPDAGGFGSQHPLKNIKRNAEVTVLTRKRFQMKKRLITNWQGSLMSMFSSILSSTALGMLMAARLFLP